MNRSDRADEGEQQDGEEAGGLALFLVGASGATSPPELAQGQHHLGGDEGPTSVPLPGRLVCPSFQRVAQEAASW